MTETASATPTPAPAPGLVVKSVPMFYTAPEILDPAHHGNLAVTPLTDLGFTRQTNSVPVTADEFFDMALHYPIVFTRGEQPAPVVVLGLGARNLFVGDDGTWAAGLPVPGYVRRYPFILFEPEGGDRLPLCIDRSAAVVVNANDKGRLAGAPLFNGTEPTEAARRALAFCEAYQHQLAATRAFTEALLAEGLLVEKQVALANASGRRHAMDGFMIVDEEKLNTLPDTLTLAWKKNGYLPALYAHLLSQRNWATLATRTDNNPPPTEKAN